MTGYDQPGITNPENVDALTHQQIYDAFQTVNDQTAEVVTTWQQARDQWRESTGRLVQAVRTAVDGQWTGVAADTAVQALSDYGTRAGQLADLFEQAGQVVANTAAAALTTKAYVPKPVPVTADQTEDPTGYDGQSRAAQQAQDDARQVMQQRYVLPFLDQDARLPAFPDAVSVGGADSSSGPLDSLLSGNGWSLTGSATTAASSGIPVNGATSTGPVGSLLSGMPGLPGGTSAHPDASSSLFGSSGTRPGPNHHGPVGSGLGTTPTSGRPAGTTGSHSGHDVPPPGPGHGKPSVAGEPKPVEHAVPENPGHGGPSRAGEPEPVEHAVPENPRPAPVVAQNDSGHGGSTGPATTSSSQTGTAGASGTGGAASDGGSAGAGTAGGSGGASGQPGQSPNSAAPAPHSSPQAPGGPATPAVPPAAPVPAAPAPLSSAPVPSAPVVPPVAPVPATPPSLPNAPVPPGPSAPMSPPAPGPGIPAPAPGSGPSAPAPSVPPSPQPGAPGSPPLGKPVPPPPAPMPNPPAAPAVPHAPTPKVPGFAGPAVPTTSPDLTPYTAAGATAISGTAAAELAQTADDSVHRIPRVRRYVGDRERYGLRFDQHHETEDADADAVVIAAEEHSADAETVSADAKVAADDPRDSAAGPSELVGGSGPQTGDRDPGARPDDHETAESHSGAAESPADEGTPVSDTAESRRAGDAGAVDGEESHTHEPAPSSGADQTRCGTIGPVPADTVSSRSTPTAPDNYRNVPPVIGE